MKHDDPTTADLMAVRGRALAECEARRARDVHAAKAILMARETHYAETLVAQLVFSVSSQSAAWLSTSASSSG